MSLSILLLSNTNPHGCPHRLWIYSNTSTASSLPATFLGVFLLPVAGVMVQLLTWRASQAGWEGLQAVQGSWRRHGCAGMVAGAKSLVVPVTYMFLGGQLLLHTTNAVHSRPRQDNAAGADTMSATSAVALIVCMLVGCGGDKTARWVCMHTGMCWTVIMDVHTLSGAVLHGHIVALHVAHDMPHDSLSCMWPCMACN